MYNKYYTTPIFYANDIPHIGHAYTTIICDFLVRYDKLKKIDTIWSTGTDEHGQKIENSAIKNNSNPKEYVDKISQKFFEMNQKLLSSDNIFTRTTSENHKKTATYIWNKIKKNGYIYMGKYSGWYAVRDEAFYQNNEIENGIAIATGAPVEWVEEDTYFFKLSSMSEKLLDFYEKNPNFIYPKERLNEIKNFIKNGLKDISVSRLKSKVSWGIPVPNDSEHTMYVWLDALSVYLTSINICDENNDKYKKYWESLNSKKIHIIGKDILRFHCIYWPAFLIAAEISLPTQIIAHGWWTNEGQKISKSLGNTIDANNLIKEFGAEYVRYFVLREMAIGDDGNFSRKNFINRINSELSDNFGNLINRICKMIETYNIIITNSSFNEQLTKNAYKLANDAIDAADSYNISQYIEKAINISSMANNYISETKPWELFKHKKIEQLCTILKTSLELIRISAILLNPILPIKSKEILKTLNTNNENISFDDIINEDYKIKNNPLKTENIMFEKLEKIE